MRRLVRFAVLLFLKIIVFCLVFGIAWSAEWVVSGWSAYWGPVAFWFVVLMLFYQIRHDDDPPIMARILDLPLFP